MGQVEGIQNGWGGVMGQIQLITIILECRLTSERLYDFLSLRGVGKPDFYVKFPIFLKYCARQTKHFGGQVVVYIIIQTSLHVDGGIGDHFIIILSNFIHYFIALNDINNGYYLRKRLQCNYLSPSQSSFHTKHIPATVIFLHNSGINAILRLTDSIHFLSICLTAMWFYLPQEITHFQPQNS